MLIPLGLHHIVNTYIWFLYGDYQTPDGHVVTGELTRFAAGDPTAGILTSGFYPVLMFGLPAAALAMIHVANKKQRKVAADFVRGYDVPLLAVNLGHVGFLAESERTDLQRTVQAIASEAYVVIERMALDVVVKVGGRQVARTWALNEASVEKSSRERMLEVVVSVDDHALSSYGCDGVVMATPTGSTAYAFSAGGPVVWPGVEALLLVPISAHTLFSRPLVVGPA